MDNATPEDVVMDDSDDPQLTIRIPNPKVYMARQSLWVGHRGKLRCDQCRAHNLKVCGSPLRHFRRFLT